MTLLPSDSLWLPPSLNEKQKTIAKILGDPDCVCHTPIVEYYRGVLGVRAHTNKHRKGTTFCWIAKFPYDFTRFQGKQKTPSF
jgi:hypothetical protein